MLICSQTAVLAIENKPRGWLCILDYNMSDLGAQSSFLHLRIQLLLLGNLAEKLGDPAVAPLLCTQLPPFRGLISAIVLKYWSHHKLNF